MPFVKPEENLHQLGLQAGMTVVDLGAGSGAYALAVAPVVGDSGRVYAVEIQSELVESLAAAAKQKQLNNLFTIWGDVERAGGTQLADGLADAVIVANVLFQLENSYSLAVETKRLLKPGGQALIVDWSDLNQVFGPHPDHVVGETKAREIFTQAGLTFVKNFPAGDHHFGLVFKR